MLDALDASLLASVARVSQDQIRYQLYKPLTDASSFGRHASNLVFSTTLAGERVPYPSLSCLHCADGVGRRAVARRGLVGKSDHAKTESDS
jgi:hypothetical protein